MDNDDDELLGNIQDPYDRLEEMEHGLINHARHIENVSRQVKQNSKLIMQISDAMKQMAKAIDQLQNQQMYIYKTIKDRDEN